eukprot:11286807-Alexandrium_andersonii.AAC.1
MAGESRLDSRTLAPPLCQPVEPVREYRPRMIAPRLEDPTGSLQRSIDIQHRGTKEDIDENNRSLFADGTPRI